MSPHPILARDHVIEEYRKLLAVSCETRALCPSCSAKLALLSV